MGKTAHWEFWGLFFLTLLTPLASRLMGQWGWPRPWTNLGLSGLTLLVLWGIWQWRQR